VLWDACHCLYITKLNEKRTGLGVKILLLVTQLCKIRHLGPCLKLYGTLVVGHFAKLLSPHRRHQFAKSTSPMMRSQVPSYTQDGLKLFKQRNYEEPRACSQLSALEGVERRVKAPKWD